MNMLILGHGESGTTIFVFKVAAGLPNGQAFAGAYFVKNLGDHENAVYKYTYNERKRRTLDLFSDYSKEINFNRKNTINSLRKYKVLRPFIKPV